MPNFLNNEQVKEFYNSKESIWPKDDKWHHYTKTSIEKYIIQKKFVFDKYINPEILNAGSGGNSYGLGYEMHHVDIIDKYIYQFPKYTVASVENMPFEKESFDVEICVGSVINYCDAVGCISELSRVLKSKGYLFLEFESSWSIDFFKTDAYKSAASIIKTKYFDEEHLLWVYSLNYILSILKNYNLELINIRRFHILSNFAYKLLKTENKASVFAKLDNVARKVPYISDRSHNIILLCQKI